MVDWVLACWCPARILPNRKMIKGLIGLIEQLLDGVRFSSEVEEWSSVIVGFIDNFP